METLEGLNNMNECIESGIDGISREGPLVLETDTGSMLEKKAPELAKQSKGSGTWTSFYKHVQYLQYYAM